MKLDNQVYYEELITKKFDKNFSISEYNLSSNKIINIVVNQSKEEIHSVFEKFINYLIDNNYNIISQSLFGNNTHAIENKIFAEKHLQNLSWPVSCIKQEDDTWSTIITAIKTKSLKELYNNEIPIGSLYNDEYADYCMLGGLMPKAKNIPRVLSIKSIFQFINSQLNNINMDFINIVRTWFYLDDLLSWYDEFNKVRNEYFTEKDIFNLMIPSSTGIGASNNDNSILLSSVFAVKPKNKNVNIYPVLSPLQCPASNYKSSFSRAVEIDHPDYRQLIISGTASINPDGQSVHIGNIYNQIELTINVVYGILKSRNMDWENITRGIVYFKNINDVKVFDNYCRENNIPKMPLAMLQADICRDELLFEIEMDAVELKNKKI